MAMRDDVCKILLSESEIKEICARLGKQISKDYKGKKLLLVSVLRGAVVFLSDLMREIDCYCEIDFMTISSYHNSTQSSGNIILKKDLDVDIKGYDVLIVEDILDSGLSLSYLLELLKKREPASIKLCAFLDKPSNRKVEISADYVGAVVPNEFVVGYGLDYADKYRNLPFVGVLDPKVYSK